MQLAKLLTWCVPRQSRRCSIWARKGSVSTAQHSTAQQRMAWPPSLRKDLGRELGYMYGRWRLCGMCG